MSKAWKTLEAGRPGGRALLVVASLVAAVGIGEARTIRLRATPDRATYNCAKLLWALGTIPNASADNPSLIRLGPGIYDCGGRPVIMKPFVDIEGSGQKTTLIRGSATSDPNDPFVAVVHGANDAQLRNLTVENTCGAGGICFGLLGQGTSVSIRTVTVTTGTARVSTAIRLWGTATLDGVTAIAGLATTSASRGVSVDGGNIEMNNVTATSLGGVTVSSGLAVLYDGTATARNSRFKGLFHAVGVAPNATVNLVSTQLDWGSPYPAGVGTFNCVAAYDKNFDALDENCDP